MTESSIRTPPVSFHLWHEPWIRATRQQDGREVTLSIGACLAEAHTLYALHDPSPLVVGGIHRLLTAILQAIYAPESPKDIAAVLRAGHFDTTMLDAFAAQHAERFDLFHPTAPFLQTGDVPLDEWHSMKRDKLKPVSYLFSEVPTATNRTLFHHTLDSEHSICPACCARGLVTIPAFASSGGQGIRPSINGVPPVYVLPVGATLFQSLVFSLTTPEHQPKAADPSRQDKAIWNGDTTIEHGAVTSDVGYLESLTFPARRVRLFPLAVRERCTRCGTLTSVIVQHMLYEMGHYRGENAGVWDDPFIARRPAKEKGGKQAEPLPVRPEAGKALWREYSTLLLANPENTELRPKIVQQIGRLAADYGVFSDTEFVWVRCISIRTDGKAKIFEWLDEALDAPPALLNDPDSALLIEDALHRADATERVLTWVFNVHFRPERAREDTSKRPDQKTVRFKTLRERMQTMFWERLAPVFRAFVHTATDHAQHPDLERTWADTLIQVGKRTFIETSDQIGERADALRIRVEAQSHCHRELYKKRKEWV